MNEGLVINPVDNFKGTWKPKLYDLDTELSANLGDQVYYKIGSLYIMTLYVSSFPNVTINTMMQIRNLPCNRCLGGQIYIGGMTGYGGDVTIQAANYIYFRPNITGTFNVGGVFTGLFIGYDS